MLRRTIITAVAAGALIAAPAVAAAQAPTTVSGTPVAASTAVHTAALTVSTGATGASAAPTAAKHHPLRWLRDHRLRLAGVLHAQWTTTLAGGGYLTHDAIHGTVTSVSADGRSITVTAADKVSQTYTTSDATKVWKVTESGGKRHVQKAGAAAVTRGSRVIVEGTGTGAPFAATRILVQLTA